MKLVREYINEKFTDVSDPIKDMGIGVDHLWNNLKEGDVIVCKKKVYINYNHRFSNEVMHVTMFSETIHRPIQVGEQLVIDEPPRKLFNERTEKPMLHINYKYKVGHEEENEYKGFRDTWIEDNIERFKKYFHIIK